jgi:hypothetical protein
VRGEKVSIYLPVTCGNMIIDVYQLLPRLPLQDLSVCYSPSHRAECRDLNPAVASVAYDYFNHSAGGRCLLPVVLTLISTPSGFYPETDFLAIDALARYPQYVHCITDPNRKRLFSTRDKRQSWLSSLASISISI